MRQTIGSVRQGSLTEGVSKITLVVLTLVVLLIHCPSAHAVGKTIWQYPTYGQIYPTQQDAVAAMQAASPQNASLTKQLSVLGMTATSAVYKYGAPSVSPQLGPWYYGGGTWGNVNTPPASWTLSLDSLYQTSIDELNQYFQSQVGAMYPHWVLCGTITLQSPATSWTPYSNRSDLSPGEIAANPYAFGSIADYAPFYLNVPATTSDNAVPCADQTVDWGTYSASRQRLASCPTNYQLSATDPLGCVDNNVDYISSTLLECPDSGSSSTQVGDPCDVSTGDFSQPETDYGGAGLTFVRSYHSAVLESHHTLGVGWTHNYAAYLTIDSNQGVPNGLLRPDGHHDAIQWINGNYESLSGSEIGRAHV